MTAQNQSNHSFRLLLSNTSWVLVAEGMARASRILTLIALSFFLDTSDYGTVMLALACHELLRVFTRLGCGAKVIQCKQESLNAYASNAITLQWAICICLCICQILLAEIIAQFYDNGDLTELIKIMAIAHLYYPIVSIKVFLLQRENRMRYFGIASGACMVAENLSTALLAVLGMGIFSVAIAKVIAAIIWVVLFSLPKVSAIRAGFDRAVMGSLLSYSGKILLTEMTRSLRQNVDMLLAGRFLDSQLFGLYSFARSTGLGLSQSLSGAFTGALYPYLCLQERENHREPATRYTLIACGAISTLFILQALFAPLYINLLFSERWADATTLVSILCLGAIPLLCLDSLCVSLRARNYPYAEFTLVLASCLLIFSSMYFFSPSSPLEFAKTFTTLSYSYFLLIAIFLLARSFTTSSNHTLPPTIWRIKT